MNHLTIATSSIFEIWFASGCQHHELAPYINHMEYPWGYALPVSHIISTHESYPQYPWGYAVTLSHILSTREDMQYPWVISSVPVSHILSTRESMQYPWGYAVPMREVSFILHSYTGTEDMTHGYWGYDSWVLNDPHGYWGYDSRVLMIWLKGTDDITHGYWGYDSRVLHILMGTDDMTHGYCISSRYWGYDSRVLHTLTGTEDMTHGYWWYDSRVMHILTGTAYSLHRVIRFWYIDISFSLTISQLISNRVLNQKLHLNIFKKGRKQGFSFRPNQRDMSTWNRYLFDYLAVFVLSQKPRQKECFFLWVQRLVRG